MDTGCGRTRSCGEKLIGLRRDSCVTLWNSDNVSRPASWLLMVPLSNSINKPGWLFSCDLPSWLTHYSSWSASLGAVTFPSGYIVHVFFCVCLWWDIRRLCPLTDIMKSYNTLLISLSPWPLTLLPESTTALCHSSSWWFEGRLLRLILRFTLWLEENDSGRGECDIKPLVSNWLFSSQQAIFMISWSQNRQNEAKITGMVDGVNPEWCSMYNGVIFIMSYMLE